FFFQAEDGIRDPLVTGVQTCALPISDTAREREIQERARQVFEMVLKHRQEAGKATTDLTEAAVARAIEEKPTARDETTNLIRQRSEERRVGKECRSETAPEPSQKRQR